MHLKDVIEIFSENGIAIGFRVTVCKDETAESEKIPKSLFSRVRSC